MHQRGWAERLGGARAFAEQKPTLLRLGWCGWALAEGPRRANLHRAHRLQPISSARTRNAGPRRGHAIVGFHSVKACLGSVNRLTACEIEEVMR